MYNICSKCVMDTSDPDITFDGKGICNHCNDFIFKEKQRKLDKQHLPWVIHDIKKQKGKYNCLIGLSGGVDSSLALHYLVEQGLRPLAFSIDNGWNTAASDEDIMRLVEGLKVPFFRYTIDLDKFRELQAAFIESGTANIEIPTDHILMATTYEMAAKYGIKYIISGGNIATESIMPSAWGYNARDERFIQSVYKEKFGKKLAGLPLCSIWKYNWYLNWKKIKIVYILDYYDYHRENAKKLLHEKYGWIDYGEKHNESIFTQWFQNHYLWTKFHYDKRKAHYSSLINSSQMTRQEALTNLQEAPIYPDLQIEFKHYPKKTYKDFKNNEYWFNVISKIMRKWNYLTTFLHR